MNLTQTLGLICIFTLGASNAFAGDVLRLKAGDIHISNQKLLNLRPWETGVTTDEGKKYFVIQFENKITEALKSQLEAAGLDIRGYVPEDALLVKAFPADAQGAALFNEVQGIVPFQAEWKLSSELAQLPEQGAEMLYITTFDNAETLSIARQIRAAGGEIRSITRQGIAARIERSRLPLVAEIEGVEWIQVYPTFITFELGLENPSSTETAPLAVTGYESGTKIMNFEAAWARGYKGKGQLVGMADTGVDTGDLATIRSDLKGVTKGIPLGWGSKSWEDANGHGTHVCGSVIGNGTASNGLIRGGAYEASMVVEGLWSPIMDNLAFSQDFEILLGKPYADGVRIHTNSWGSAASPSVYDAFAVKADTFLWNHPDMLVLFAAGNDGADKNQDGRIDESSMASPATAKNVLTVGASENFLAEGGIQKPIGSLRDGDKKWGVEPLKSDTLSNNPDGMAAFSSRGPTKDGRIKPDVVAPGTNIVSSRSAHPKAGQLWGAYDANYAYAGGTSMATPLTAGAATVVREYLIKSKKIATPSAALIKGTLMHTAKDMFPGQYGRGPSQELPKARPNIHEGYGRVDVDKATNLDSSTLVDDTTGVGTAEEKSVTISVSAGGSLRATLVYTDAPGIAASAKALVNDIDLQVVSPVRGLTQLSDRANNAEMIELANLPAGQYRVVVKGVNVPQGKNGKQPYALLVTQF